MSTSSPMPPRPVSGLFCSNCGAQVLPGQTYCPKCAAPQPTQAGYMPPVTTAAVGARYAGFWIRFAAWLLDAIIVGVVFSPVQMGIFGAMGVSMGLGAREQDP